MSIVSRTAHTLRCVRITSILSRNYSIKVRKPLRASFVDKKFKSKGDSLASKGFLRPIKPYDPPADAEATVLEICSKCGVTDDRNTPIGDPAIRFNTLKECFERFQHGVPNSILCYIETINDIVNFYKTPVDVTNPYDALKRQDLPKNLHVQYDYHRFHPDTDTMFNGVSAFPKSSTLISSIKYRKKYAGYIAEGTDVRE